MLEIWIRSRNGPQITFSKSICVSKLPVHILYKLSKEAFCEVDPNIDVRWRGISGMYPIVDRKSSLADHGFFVSDHNSLEAHYYYIVGDSPNSFDKKSDIVGDEIVADIFKKVLGDKISEFEQRIGDDDLFGILDI